MPDNLIRANSPDAYIAAVLRVEREKQSAIIFGATREYAEGAVIGAVASTLGKKLVGPSCLKK